ncbi:MAG: NDP-sugar synthase [Rubrobacter sp.]|nr:NDP-sugar synthase [Rubrobacter sp.]
MKAMVLAAGKGTRLAPLTSELPKPMLPVAGKPMIGHIFELLERHGASEVHVNAYHLAEVILERYGWETRINGMKVKVTREEELLGTAGGVRQLSEHFDETFVVIMGDALTDVDLRELVAFHRAQGALATLALMPVADTRQFGVVALDPDGNIRAFQEKPEPGEAMSNLANTGIYVLEPEALEYIPEETFFDFAKDVFPQLLAAGERFVGYRGSFYWSDVGTLQAYREAQRDVLSGRVWTRVPGERWDESLWVDREARIHPTAILGEQTVIGRGATVEPGAVLTGCVAVGQSCRVEPDSTVRRSVLLTGSSVGEGAHLEDCIIGPGYEVPPGEWLRGEVLVTGARSGKHGPLMLSKPF